MKSEIRNDIISCGSVAGEKLISIFNDPAHADFRENIILIWRDMDYTNVAPMLIQLLKDHDQFWAEQKLTTNWWNTDVGSELTEKRWEAINFENPQIVEECKAALKEFTNQK